ncbi:hypothetical protein GPN2_20891 [Streptomyces murinus]
MIRPQAPSAVRELTHFVDGRHFLGTSGAHGEVYDPDTGEVQALVPLADRGETTTAISSAAAHVYATAAAHGKRAQCFGGVKDHLIVMPDADLDQAVDALIGAGSASTSTSVSRRAPNSSWTDGTSCSPAMRRASSPEPPSSTGSPPTCGSTRRRSSARSSRSCALPTMRRPCACPASTATATASRSPPATGTPPATSPAG